MADYKLTTGGLIVLRAADGASIPIAEGAEGNRDYAEYLAWLAAGNTPDPADPPPAPEPSRGKRIGALVADAKQALAGASTLSQVKSVFAAALDGLAALDNPEAAP